MEKINIALTDNETVQILKAIGDKIQTEQDQTKKDFLLSAYNKIMTAYYPNIIKN